jgi:hypothetical protein
VTERAGGTAVRAPSIVPPIGVELSDEQKLACAFRILARDGLSENIAGHITWQHPDSDTMLVNPWGLWWREIPWLLDPEIGAAMIRENAGRGFHAVTFPEDFWFCAAEDRSTFALRDRIGVGHILLESDYPPCDSTWPHTQSTVAEELAGLPDADVRRITGENAAELYQHAVPGAVRSDPDAY